VIWTVVTACRQLKADVAAALEKLQGPGDPPERGN
jgi:hypothetical protein